MKLHSLLLLAIATVATAGCSSAANEGDSPLERAQNAYVHNRYVRAQTICDSMLLGDHFHDLDVCQLTDLSLLLMRLGEHSNDADINTAFAARCIKGGMEPRQRFRQNHNAPAALGGPGQSNDSHCIERSLRTNQRNRHYGNTSRQHHRQ